RDLETIDLVINEQLRQLRRTDLLEHRIDLCNLFGAPRVAGVDHVQQERRRARLGEGGLEGRYKLVRQLADEAYRVGNHHRRTARQHDAPHGRIESRKQLVGDVGVAARERPKERRLAGVGVTDQRQRGHRDLRAHLPPRLTLLTDLLQALGQHAHALPDDAPVGFQLRLPGAAQADAALLALKVCPAAHQATGDMLQLRELHFQLALKAAGALREDVEDQAIAVEHAPFGELLEVAFLARGQRMIHQDHVRFARVRQLPELLRLATAEKVARIGPVTAAGERRDRQRAGRYGQLPELLQVLRIYGGAQSQAHEYGALTSPWAFEHSGFPRARTFIQQGSRERRRPLPPAARCAPARRWRLRACRPSG